jgi:UDP-N-acetyl-D-mannosaminuronate dehydrogenase
VIRNFEDEGAIVEYFDPFVKEYKFEDKYKKSLEMLTAELIQQADLVVVTTAHTNIDYEFIQRNANYIFDTKNALKNVKNRENIELL